jgi:hypothetical protein
VESLTKFLRRGESPTGPAVVPAYRVFRDCTSSEDHDYVSRVDRDKRDSFRPAHGEAAANERAHITTASASTRLAPIGTYGAEPHPACASRRMRRCVAPASVCRYVVFGLEPRMSTSMGVDGNAR